MRMDDKRERLQARITEDIRTLKSMVAEDDTLLRGYLRLIATAKTSEAREMLSLLLSVNDNIHRLESIEQGGADIAYDELAYHSLGQTASLFVGGSPCAAQ